jgi:valyl-tRNA synthetase
MRRKEKLIPTLWHDLNKLNNVARLNEFEFAKATKELYSWVWDDLANGYLEYCKDKISQKKHLLLHLIWETIQQAHLFIPHITSEMSQLLMTHCKM